MFLIVDTCQAYSMTQKLYSPNILGVGSSLVGEDSLSVRSSLCTGTLIKFRMTVQSRTGTQDLSFQDWYFNRAEKNWIPACLWGKQLSHFAFSERLLACLSQWFCKRMTCLDPVSFKSYLPNKKIYAPYLNTEFTFFFSWQMYLYKLWIGKLSCLLFSFHHYLFF